MDCEHPFRRIEYTPQGPHHAKEVCTTCNRFVRWLPKPETLERIKRNGEIVASLKNHKMTAWEKQFVGSLEFHLTKISPKQQDILTRIALHYGV